MHRTAALAAALMLSAAPALAADCTATSPVTPAIVDAALAAYAEHGDDAVYNLQGTASCPDISDTLAVASALSMPIWLGDKENFAVSGGIGFSDDAAAIGATAVARINSNLAAFAGGAVSTDNSDVWAGRAGLRLGW
jgi:hypothetical protein